MHVDSGCSPKVETTLDKEAIATIKVHSPCAAFAKISAHHIGLSTTLCKHNSLFSWPKAGHAWQTKHH
jgi:hypothetical protein